MIRLASLRAICDEEQQPKESSGENADKDKRDSDRDSYHRLHGVVMDRAYGV